MANVDQSVAAVLDRTANDSDVDEDQLIDELENDDELDGFRERRLQQLHEEVARQKLMRQSEHGTYQEIKDEKALMDITTSTKLCVVHFFKPDFNRCRIMDKHLEVRSDSTLVIQIMLKFSPQTLATSHFDTRFLKINVDNAPFLVTKLKVQVLPCVLAFVEGVSKDRILGFEGLGRGTDSFTTPQLEARLLQSGVLVRQKIVNAQPNSAQTSKNHRARRDDSDDDEWD